MKEADFSRKSDHSARKRTRKRSYTRKASLSSSFINMAEARREIVNALHLHRSSSSFSSSSKPAVLCSSSHHQNYYHQLTDSMPIPEPTWSTTAPAVLCAPVPSMEVLEVEWFDNVSSSYSWWIGFLNSLDGKKDAVNESMENNSEGLRPCLDAKDVEKSALDVNDHQSPFMDEWVIFPAAEEYGEQV